MGRSVQISVIVALAVISACASPPAAADPEVDWRTDWAVEEGFSLAIDSEGFSFPTALAFVPQPGPGAKDPLYFVTELRGRVRVVTNDRTVYTFAEDFFTLEPREELPAEPGEVGLAGVCLAPDQGYVFVTFAYHDDTGILRNSVARFATEPRTFALEPSSITTFHEIFSGQRAGVSHQIGACQVDGGELYVGVGEGGQPFESQNVRSTLGKVLRMTLDGLPVADNPFYEDDDVGNPANFVWAYGLRNPFSLAVEDGRVFVADNGIGIDRFLEAERGINYLWDGTDWSIGAGAAVVISPAVGPVQMEREGARRNVFPAEYAGGFFIATSGVPSARGASTRRGTKGIMIIDYDLGAHRLRQPPRTFALYRGSGYQSVVGLAFGPDGLYFAPLFPDAEGRSAVLRVASDPTGGHPYTVADALSPQYILGEKGCYSCHILDARGYGTVGPRLDHVVMVPRLLDRLHSTEYEERLRAVDAIEQEPFVGYREARRGLLDVEGFDRVRTYIRYKLEEPRFDDPDSQMPNMGLSSEQSALLTEYLLGGSAPPPAGLRNLAARARTLVPRSRAVVAGLAFGAGLGTGMAVLLLGLVLVRRRP
jgi:glucose/arabinose dehydrogenase